MLEPYIWLITGASRGLGLELALSALRAGHQVLATARDVPRARSGCPELERLGGIWMALDVTDRETQTIVSQAVEEHGVNVVVNNAGYAVRGAVEDLSMAQAREIMETNYLGTLAVTKGAIPHFRTRRSGTIVMVSSGSGFNGTPSQSQYSVTKFAMEGMSESLARELQPFDVRVIVVEPGMLRTDFQLAVDEVPFSEPYIGTPAHQAAMKNAGGHWKQLGDPVKVALAIMDVVTGTGQGERVRSAFRVLLGTDTLERARWKLNDFKSDVDASNEIAASTDFAM